MDASPDSPDSGNSIAASPDNGRDRRPRVPYASDLLDQIRSIISVLINIGTLIDKALAVGHHLGMPMLRHA